MNKLVFICLLLPLFSNAQTEKEETNKMSDGKLVLVHADKTVSVPVAKKEGMKHPKDNIKYYGAVQFKIGGNQVSCDSATIYENEDMADAYNVTITNPEYFSTKADMLSYNKETKMGTVTKNVTVTALNGNVIGTSESVQVDFKRETYRIGMGAITPPEPVK